MEAMLQSFQAPDSILEPKIYDAIAGYIKEGGQPLALVNALSTSYVGVPEMCNVMAGWAREFDIDPVDVIQEVLKEQLMERFDPESVDREFTSGDNEFKTVMESKVYSFVLFFVAYICTTAIEENAIVVYSQT